MRFQLQTIGFYMDFTWFYLVFNDVQRCSWALMHVGQPQARKLQAPGPFRGRKGELEHGDGVVGAPEVGDPLGVEGDDVGGEGVAAQGRI